MTLSVVIITFNEEHNLPRTLESVKWADEIVVVDSGSTDRTVEIAKSYGAKVWVEPWKGFAAQKNSALEKATCDWILSLDADEEVSEELASKLRKFVKGGSFQASTRMGFAWVCNTNAVEQAFSDLPAEERVVPFPDSGALVTDFVPLSGVYIARKNMFLGRWVKHGGYYSDFKLRLVKRGSAKFEDRLVHEDVDLMNGAAVYLRADLIHHAYPTLSGYIEHMNRYSSLGAEMAKQKGKGGFSFINMVIRPIFTFVYNYFFRLGFLDGREGLLLHMYHSVYVSWKYAKLWEITRKPR